MIDMGGFPRAGGLALLDQYGRMLRGLSPSGYPRVDVLTAAAGDDQIMLGGPPVPGTVYVEIDGTPLPSPGAGRSIALFPLVGGETVVVAFHSRLPAPSASSVANSGFVRTTWDPTMMGSGISLSDGNRKATATGSGDNTLVMSVAGVTGKAYFEILLFNNGFAGLVVCGGVCDATESTAVYTGETAKSVSVWDPSGEIWGANAYLGSVGAASGSTSRICVAVNQATRKVWMKRYGSAWSGDPAAGTGEVATLGGSAAIHAAATPFTSPCAVTLVADPMDMLGSPPSGFTAGL